MNFYITSDKKVKLNTCHLTCNTNDFEHLKEMIKFLQKRDYCLHVYDHERTMIILPISLIYYIESIDNKTYIYTNQSFYRSFEHFSTLKKLYYCLGLRQINKNTIVNIHFILKMKITNDCRRIITLENQEKLVVNRNFRNFLNE